MAVSFPTTSAVVVQPVCPYGSSTHVNMPFSGSPPRPVFIDCGSSTMVSRKGNSCGISPCAGLLCVQFAAVELLVFLSSCTLVPVNPSGSACMWFPPLVRIAQLSEIKVANPRMSRRRWLLYCSKPSTPLSVSRISQWRPSSSEHSSTGSSIRRSIRRSIRSSSGYAA